MVWRPLGTGSHVSDDIDMNLSSICIGNSDFIHFPIFIENKISPVHLCNSGKNSCQRGNYITVADSRWSIDIPWWYTKHWHYQLKLSLGCQWSWILIKLHRSLYLWMVENAECFPRGSANSKSLQRMTSDVRPSSKAHEQLFNRFLIKAGNYSRLSFISIITWSTRFNRLQTSCSSKNDISYVSL